MMWLIRGIWDVLKTDYMPWKVSCRWGKFIAHWGRCPITLSIYHTDEYGLVDYFNVWPTWNSYRVASKFSDKPTYVCIPSATEKIDLSRWEEGPTVWGLIELINSTRAKAFAGTSEGVLPMQRHKFSRIASSIMVLYKSKRVVVFKNLSCTIIEALRIFSVQIRRITMGGKFTCRSLLYHFSVWVRNVFKSWRKRSYSSAKIPNSFGWDSVGVLQK